MIANPEQLAVIEVQRGDAQAALAAAQQEPADGGWQEIALALARQIGSDRTAADAALKHLMTSTPMSRRIRSPRSMRCAWHHER